MKIERNGQELVLVSEDWEALTVEELAFLKKINLAGVWTDFDDQDRLKLSMFDGSGSTNKRRILTLMDAAKIFKIALSDDVQALLNERLAEAEKWIEEIAKVQASKPKETQKTLYAARLYTKGLRSKYLGVISN